MPNMRVDTLEKKKRRARLQPDKPKTPRVKYLKTFADYAEQFGRSSRQIKRWAAIKTDPPPLDSPHSWQVGGLGIFRFECRPRFRLRDGNAFMRRGTASGYARSNTHEGTDSRREYR